MFKQLFLVFAVVLAFDDLPTLDGKFFYADFSPKGPYGLHMVSMGVGQKTD